MHLRWISLFFHGPYPRFSRISLFFPVSPWTFHPGHYCISFKFPISPLHFSSLTSLYFAQNISGFSRISLYLPWICQLEFPLDLPIYPRDLPVSIPDLPVFLLQLSVSPQDFSYLLQLCYSKSSSIFLYLLRVSLYLYQFS
jgi:hypothetical protein